MLNYNVGDFLNSRFKLLQQVGKGGFSIVWLVEDTYTETEVVVKIYAPDRGLDESGLNQFKKEYKRTRGLNHSNLLTPEYFDILDDIQAPYLVMPYCSGGSLEKLVREEKAITEDQIAQIFIQIGGGLAELHRNQIIHQDIKPDNILIRDDGHYMLTDFGISRQMRSTMNKATANQSYMTVAYSPPERYAKNPVETPASDIFSLGVTLFELCKKEIPWGGVGGMVLNSGAFVPELGSEYSGRLNVILSDCMDPDHTKRPSAVELQELGKQFIKDGFWPKKEETTHIDLPEEKKNQRKTVKLNYESLPVNEPLPDDKVIMVDGPESFNRRKGIKKFVFISFSVMLAVVSAWYIGSALYNSYQAEQFYNDGLKAYLEGDYETAKDLMYEAYYLDNFEACYFLGKIEEYSEFGVVSYNRSESKENVYQLASFDQSVGAVPENPTSSAEYWYELGVSYGDEKANYGLATITEADADSYYEKSFSAILEAANEGNLYWSYVYSTFLRDGIGVEINSVSQFNYLEGPALAGFSPAQKELGDMYLSGVGVSKNYKTAEKFYSQAAENANVSAQKELALMYYSDSYEMQDYKEAIKWFDEAAKSNELSSLNYLGYMYDKGVGVEQDYNKAYNYYLRAADLGYDYAQNNLGIMYMNGKGITKDYTQAYTWLKKAADQGFESAYSSLGNLYYYGNGVQENKKLALEFYLKSAQSGNVIGKYNTALMYENGYGTEVNISEALKWYQEAADRGYEDAKKKVEELKAKDNSIYNSLKFGNN